MTTDGEQLGPRAYIAEWGADLIAKWQHDTAMLGKLVDAYVLICTVREAQEKAEAARAYNALFGNVSPGLEGKTRAELRALAMGND